jgi:hypothetical protein
LNGATTADNNRIVSIMINEGERGGLRHTQYYWFYITRILPAKGPTWINQMAAALDCTLAIVAEMSNSATLIGLFRLSAEWCRGWTVVSVPCVLPANELFHRINSDGKVQ